MARKPFRLSQNQLFAAILVELTESLGDTFATARLIEAADQLAKLIEKEFRPQKAELVAHSSNYFTHDTASAIHDRAWQIVREELRFNSNDDDIYDPYFVRDRLKQLGIFYD